MRKIICQCISYVTMTCDISIIDRQMMYRISGFLSLAFLDPIPHRFDQCLGIQLGDIVSPRCLLTESDISACLSPSNAISIQVTLSLIASLQMSENHGLLKRFGTAEVL